MKGIYMKNLFQGSINHEQINQLSLKQLKTINKILDGKFKTEKQKMKEVKKSFPNIINGSGVIIND
jgi:hypothetical protein